MRQFEFSERHFQLGRCLRKLFSNRLRLCHAEPCHDRSVAWRQLKGNSEFCFRRVGPVFF